MTCSVVGFSVLVTGIGRPTGQLSEVNPLHGWKACSNSQTDTIVRLYGIKPKLSAKRVLDGYPRPIRAPRR
jgi:hypothetical protein